MKVADQKFRALEQLPEFPAIATKVLRVLAHDDAQIQEIAGLIRADGSLAAELLRIVNSPRYAFSSRISSVQKAITILGFDAVKRFMLAVSMKGFFQPTQRLDLLRGMWRHSLACALICEELSAACSTSQSRDDRAYTCALLHDIGRLGLFVVYPVEYAALLTGTGTDGGLRQRERRAFGVDHCEAGGWLAKNWELPEEVQTVAASHHDPPRSSVFELEDLVRVGVLLTDCLGFDVAPSERAYTLEEIRAMLPQSAQYRFDPDAAAMTAEITGKLDAFD